MYANLIVSIGARPLKTVNGNDLYDEEVSAYNVAVTESEAVVYLDDPDDDGDYYKPVGQRVVDLRTHAIAVCADF